MTEHTENTPPPARGFVRRAASVLGGVFGVLYWLVLGLWLFGQVTTDRTLMGQYLFWFGPVVLVTALALLLVSWLLRLAGRAPKKKRVRWARLAAGAAVLYAVVGGFNLLAPLRHLWQPAPPDAAIRIVHWNRSGFACPDPAAAGAALAAGGPADIAFVSIMHLPEHWKQITRNMTGGDNPGAIHMVSFGAEKIFSRFPVLSSAQHLVSMQPAEPGQGPTPENPAIPRALRSFLIRCFHTFGLGFRPPEEIEDASVIVVRFDTTQQLGRVLTAYFIDMPSNPLASRRDIAARVAARINELQHDADPRRRLPPADLIIGDFNIPLGSASLKTYLPGGGQASSTAGIGRLASWPRPRCVFQLDHALLAPGWRAGEYRLADPGCSEHLAQTFRLWPEGK